MIISRQLTRLSLAGVLVGLSLAANARSQPEQASADIRRTSFGVPHIRAENERGLGYGIGYAYAQDNLCLLANEIITVNGERSRYFGPEQFTVEERENQVSDRVFHLAEYAAGRRRVLAGANPGSARPDRRLCGRLQPLPGRNVARKVCRSNARATGCGTSPRRTWSS